MDLHMYGLTCLYILYTFFTLNFFLMCYRYLLFVRLYLNGDDLPAFCNSSIFQYRIRADHHPGGILVDSLSLAGLSVVIGVFWIVIIPGGMLFCLGYSIRRWNLEAKKVISRLDGSDSNANNDCKSESM